MLLCRNLRPYIVIHGLQDVRNGLGASGDHAAEGPGGMFLSKSTVAVDIAAK